MKRCGSSTKGLSLIVLVLSHNLSLRVLWMALTLGIPCLHLLPWPFVKGPGNKWWGFYHPQSLRRLCFYACLSFCPWGWGLLQCMVGYPLLGQTPPGSRYPTRSRHPQEQTPPWERTPPPPRSRPPRSRPPRMQTPPQEQTPSTPLGADTPRSQTATAAERYALLLECILVLVEFFTTWEQNLINKF